MSRKGRGTLSHLFAPYETRGVTLRNRLVMAPMCQYSAERDGRVTDWHLVHLGARAQGGVGLVIVEATSVESRGRLSTGDVGLWDDMHVEGLSRIVRFVKSQGAKIGIQLAHAGRKADCGEEVVGASARRFSDHYDVPRPLTDDEVEGVIAAFAAAAERAVAAGFDLVELHAAHGYLIEQFLSPVSNDRQDRWGLVPGRKNLFLRRLTDAVRARIGEMPLWIRVSAAEFDEDGLGPADVGDLLAEVRDRIDLVDVSAGGMVRYREDEYPGYRVALAETVRERADLPIGIVGHLESPELAEFLVASGKADVVVVARGLLRDPHLAQTAAIALRAKPPVPVQYARAFGELELDTFGAFQP